MSLFENIVEKVSQVSPLQKKRLRSYIAEQSADFFAEAEDFATKYSRYLRQQGVPLGNAVTAYVKLCNDMLRYQIHFMQTGKYPTGDADEAYRAVYSNGASMTSYMMGLALSQFLWPTHYQMYRAFREWMQRRGADCRSYLEVGPGHGLYLCKALELLPRAARIVVVDISKTSLDMTRALLECVHKDGAQRVTYVLRDVNDFAEDSTFDFITMGEVLEHVNEPARLLRKLAALLGPSGRAFLSTCANAPAIDHVVHFNRVDEIRDLLEANRLAICDERVLPVENLSMEEIEAKKVTVNYCALLQRGDHGQV